MSVSLTPHDEEFSGREMGIIQYFYVRENSMPVCMAFFWHS